MTTWRGWAWWAIALPLLPLLLPMALWTRRRAVRLPVAAGLSLGLSGEAFADVPLRLLVLGESTVAGVGVSFLDDALPGQLAKALAQQLQRPVAWRAVGENGITAAQACQRWLPLAQESPAELVVLVFGVNDTTHFSSTRSWNGGLERLIEHFQAQGAQVVCTCVPPLQHFSALPWLLRQLLGWRARLLDAQLRLLAQRLGAGHCPAAIAMREEYLAIDGYHPSALGYRVWAQLLAQWLSDEAAGARLGRSV